MAGVVVICRTQRRLRQLVDDDDVAIRCLGEVLDDVVPYETTTGN